MPLVQPSETLTPREAYMLEYEKDQEIRQIEFGLQMKRLDIEADKVATKWQSLFKLPVLLLRLPLLLILGVAYIVHVCLKREPSDNFWNLLK